jgi:hypothetical protein
MDPFSVVAAFFMHVGSRHIQFDLTDAQKQLISYPSSRFIILLAMFYISTRSLLWSCLLLAAYILLIYMLLNEKHPLNVFSRSWLQAHGFLPVKENEKTPVQLYMENIARLT